MSRKIWNRLQRAAIAGGVGLLLAACVPGVAPQPGAASEPGAAESGAAGASVVQAGTRTLVVAAHDSFAVSEEVVAAFEAEQNATVQFLALGDAGEALNKLILSREAPLADVFFGVDNTFLSRALEADIFVSYAAPALEQIPAALALDPEHRLLPVDYGFVTLNADKGWFEQAGLPLPATLADLIDPAYRGLLVVPGAATSSPGLAFLLATIGALGDEWPAFWEGLRANDVLVVDGWSQAYYEHFTVGSGGTGGSAGDRPLVVSYTTSPPADVLYATDGRTEPASQNLNLPGGVFQQVEFVGIVQGTQQLELAQAWVDFMLALPLQEDIPLQMFVYPANPAAALPESFAQFAPPPDAALTATPLDAAAIEANREAWVAQWSEIMLR